MRRSAPAVARNREPIRDVLSRHVVAGDRVLEIAAGSGEHAVFLADVLPVASWLPSDPDAVSRASIDAWRQHLSAEKVLPAMDLPVHLGPWPTPGSIDVVIAINMIHISPWEHTLALLDGVATLGARLLYLYGPYRRNGTHTAESNEAFEGWLKGLDPRFGVRDLEAVLSEGLKRGYVLGEIVEMPANNLSVVLLREGSGGARTGREERGSAQ